MASEPSAVPPESSSESTPDQLSVNLQVLSPSVGVNRPLLFPSLSASTTVKQLKEKIRQTLPLRPADENQRLIHRGRAIVRESDTLVDIFGEEALRSPDQQTIHLVIRDAHDTHTPTPPASIRGPSPTAQAQPANVPRQTAPHPYGPHPPPAFTRRNPMPSTSNPFPQPRMPSPSPIHTPEQAAAFQHHHQNMTQWLSHIQREAMARAMANQNQRNRVQIGMRGVGDPAGHATHNAGDNSGRGSPAPGHTIYREHFGPNGHTYQVETVVRNSAPATPGGGMSPAEVADLIRGADANQATLAMTNAMQRSVSSASQHNRPASQPAVINPTVPPPSSTDRGGRATPDVPTGRSTGVAPFSSTTPGSSQGRPGQGLEVYVLSSPEGPRALLINHTNLETYWTPRLRQQASLPQLRFPATSSNLGNDLQAQTRPHHHHHHHHHHPRPPQQQQPQQAPQLQQLNQQLQQQLPQQYQDQLQQLQQPQQAPQLQQLNQQLLQQLPQQYQQQVQQLQQQQQQQQVQDQARQNPAVGIMHPGNPPVAAAIPALLLQLWPQIWLLFRLALFVWFFTSPDASWARWLVIIAVAVFIFVMSTGVLNGFGDLARRGLGRHLENLIPPLEHMGRPRPAEQGQEANPNPAEMAARLVADHHGPGSWLTAQIRRIERASLLFLASIAPGVAERHIANLEAQERADRLRLEAEAAEAARQAELANEEAPENAGNDGEDDTNRNGGEGSRSDENTVDDSQHQPESGQEGGVQGNGDNHPREQLIEV